MEQRKQEIDITITATLRPELLERTLQSFFSNMFLDWPVRAIINVDYAGGPVSAVSEIQRIMRKYFSRIVMILSETPHFGRAFHKVWSLAGTDCRYVFHLEDDWELTRFLPIGCLIEEMSKDSKLAILRLPQNDAPLVGDYKDWNLFYPYNGCFYEVPKQLLPTVGFCGHPSLIRSDFVRTSLMFLDRDLNPEKQLKGICRGRIKWLSNCRLGVFCRPGESKAIVDIGRKWREEKGIGKQGPDAIFTNWQE